MDAPVFTMVGGFLIALGVGILTGLFGIGGGFLMTPLLIILLRIPAAIAIGTGLAVIAINSLIGLWQRRGSGTVDLKLACVTSIGALGGVVLGQRLMLHLQTVPPLVFLGRRHNTLEYLVMLVFLVVLLWIGLFMYLDLRQNAGQVPSKRVGWFARLKWGPSLSFPSLEEPRIAAIPLLLAGMLIGILTGLIGIGGGVIWLPTLVYLVGQRALKAAGTSLLLAAISSFFGGGLNVIYGNVSIWLGGGMLIGGAAGTLYGTRLGLKLTGPRLRFGFIFVVLAAIILIGAKLVVMTFSGEAS